MISENFRQAAAELAAQGIETRENERLAPHTTFGIGGPAALFCVPKSAEQLAFAIKTARAKALPWRCLGRGSNVLFRDEGYDGLIICLAGVMDGLAVQGDRIEAGAGATLAALCEAACEASLAGLAFAYGIPGTVGGAIYMNAGAFGGDMAGVLESVAYLDEDLQMRSLTAGQAELGYRESVFQRRPWVVLSAAFRLRQGNRAAIAEEMEAHMAYRRAKQPLELPSAGSVFKRPQGAFAGALIDQSGLRGHRLGDAAVSEKHCGFIVNLGQASCADVLALADYVVGEVKHHTGYTLEREIHLITEQDL